MNSLNRAKQFIRNKASKLALAVVPLAALAVAPSAHADAVLGGGTCVAQASGSCTITENGSGANSQLDWIQAYGTAMSSSGSFFALIGTPEQGNPAQTPGSLMPGTVPVAWNFMVSGSGTAFGWDVRADLLDSMGGTVGSFSESGSGMFGTPIVGNGLMNVSGGTVAGYDLSIEVFGDNGTSSLTLEVPANVTLDLNAPAQSSVPEPATFGIAALGGGALLVIRRRRKA